MAQKKGTKGATLTDKQERFVQELIKGKSQREAYRAAYPKSIKWEDNSVDINASQLFSGTKVKLRYNEIHDRLVKEAEDECIVDAKMVLKELANIAFANVTDYINVKKDTDGEGKTTSSIDINDTTKLEENKKAALAEISTTQTGIKIKQHDKVKALELLGKHLKLFTDKVESSVTVNGALTDLSNAELEKMAEGEE